MGEKPVQGKKPKASNELMKEQTAPVKQNPSKGKGTQKVSAEDEAEVLVQKHTMYESSSESDDSEGHLALQEACKISRQVNEQYFTQQVT